MSISVRSKATASTRATIFYLCTGVKACLDLKPGQTLIVEELGDLTVPSQYQQEVKAYKEPLTDQHPNFWNTLYNWCLGGIDTAVFPRLLLTTTQMIGPTARLAQWNELSGAQRMQLLEVLHQESEKRFRENGAVRATVPVGLKQQRELLAPDVQAQVAKMISKVVIEAEASQLTELAQQIMDGVRGVSISRRQPFLNALIGFVCRTDLSSENQWQISFEKFNEEYSMLLSRFGLETREFPTEAFEGIGELSEEAFAGDLFVKKIRDIEHDEEIPYAIRDYEAAVKTIGDVFRNYTSGGTRYIQYRHAVERRFHLSFKSACNAEVLDNIAAQNFYNATLSSPPPSFSGYADSPDWFRNGLLHTLMNDEEKPHQWKLDKK